MNNHPQKKPKLKNQKNQDITPTQPDLTLTTPPLEDLEAASNNINY